MGYAPLGGRETWRNIGGVQCRGVWARSWQAAGAAAASWGQGEAGNPEQVLPAGCCVSRSPAWWAHSLELQQGQGRRSWSHCRWSPSSQAEPSQAAVAARMRGTLCLAVMFLWVMGGGGVADKIVTQSGGQLKTFENWCSRHTELAAWILFWDAWFSYEL